MSLLFTVSGKDIVIDDLVITDDLSSYHNTMAFTASSKIYGTEGKLKVNGAEYEVHIESQVRTDAGMKIECVTKKVHNAFSSVIEGYTGSTTINGLFRKLGYDYKSDYASNNTYFTFDRCMVTTLFDTLTRYASFANGGSAHFYMNADGVVMGYDYKLIKEKGKAKPMSATIQSESLDTGWLNFTPSEYELHCWDESNKFKIENYVLIKGHGKSVVDVNDTTGKWKDALKQELANVFYNKWYSSRVMAVSVVPNSYFYNVGDLVKVNEYDGDIFIVKSVSLGIRQQQDTPTYNAVLIAEPTL